ncbi:MAG: glycosyltransferase [Candidatus Binatia bacterium]
MEPAVAATRPDLDALAGSPARRELPDGPRVLVFTTLFPNPAQPRLGVFVRDRVAAVAAHCPTRVVAPVQSPFGRWLRKGPSARVPVRECQAGLDVYHPRFTTTPGVGRFADGFLLYLQTLAQTVRLRKEFAFDLIDAHYAFPDGTAAVLLGRHFRVPVCITVRGGDLDLLPRYRMRRRVISWTLRHAGKLLAVSQHLASRAEELGADQTRVRVVPNGIDASTFSPVDQREARRRTGIPETMRLLVCVGNLTPEKGQHIVVEALARLAANGPGAPHLVLIGNDQWGAGEYGPQVERRVQQLGMSDRVRLIGSRPQTELALWYSAADLLVLPTFREGCPNVVREALSCGLPVVASRVGGVPELISSDDVGLLVDAGDVESLAAAITTGLQRRWSRTTIAAIGGRRTWPSVGAIVAGELRELVRPNAEGRSGAVGTARRLVG